MPRNGGALVDVARECVRDRNGQIYPLDQIAVADGALYYARSIQANRLFDYQWRWIVPARDLVLNRFRFHAHARRRPDWYIETDFTDISGGLWTVSDGFLDIEVYDGVRYEVEDAGELAEAITAREIPLDEAVRALTSLDRVCETLRRNGCSGRALLNELAPTLARADT